MANKYPSSHNLRRSELAKIHMAASQLGMDTGDKSDESEYRGMLWTVARVRSSAALDWAGRKKVLDHLGELMEARGIKMASKNAGAPVGVKPELIPLMSKVGALLADMKLPWRYLTASRDGSPSMLKRITGVDKLEWANAKQLHDLVTALVKRQANPPKPPFVKGGKSGARGDL